jgi:serine protease Do
MASLNGLETAIAEAAERIGPAVVGLGRGWGVGSGVVVGEGRVLTNAHNIRSEEVTVSFADDRRETGEVAGLDQDADVAVIEVDTGRAPPVAWEPSADTPGIGTAVIALANPGGRGLRATLGFVSSQGRSFRGPRGRRVRGAIEHTAPLPRGSSGGPLVDASGRLLGVNTVRLEGGLIVALAADKAFADRVERLARGEEPATPRLGVALAPPRVARRMRRAVGLPEREGLLVRAVQDGSAADRAGVQRGDLLVKAGERELDGLDALYGALDDAGPSGTLALTVLRGTDEHDLTVSFNGAGGETV